MDEQTIERIAERVADDMFSNRGESWRELHDTIYDAIQEETAPDPTPTGPTVDVRVPLIVGADAQWMARGGDHDRENEVFDMLSEYLERVTARHILTATVALPPAASEVRAGVEGVEGDN